LIITSFLQKATPRDPQEEVDQPQHPHGFLPPPARNQYPLAIQ
jgi:hypothetical protein